MDKTTGSRRGRRARALEAVPEVVTAGSGVGTGGGRATGAGSETDPETGRKTGGGISTGISTGTSSGTSAGTTAGTTAGTEPGKDHRITALPATVSGPVSGPVPITVAGQSISAALSRVASGDSGLVLRRARTQAKIEQLIGAGDTGSPLTQNLWLLDALQDMHRYATAEGLTAFAAHLAEGGDLLMDEIRQITPKTRPED